MPRKEFKLLIETNIFTDTNECWVLNGWVEQNCFKYLCNGDQKTMYV